MTLAARLMLIRPACEGLWKKISLQLIMSISRAMHRINLMYKFNQWIPHELTQADKDKRAGPAYQRKDKILDRIITSDEKWIHFNNISRQDHKAQFYY